MRAVRRERRAADVIAVLSDKPKAEVNIAVELEWGGDRPLLTRTLAWLCAQEYVAEVDRSGARLYVLGQRLWRKRPI